MNWINGRGYNVSSDVTIKRDVITSVLKTSADALVELNSCKNHIGSSLAGCIGRSLFCSPFSHFSTLDDARV